MHLHGDATEHDLRQHTADQADRQPRQIPTSGPTQQRTEHREHHGHGDEAGEQTVDLFDGRMPGADIDELSIVASGPVVAPEARSGQAHRGAGDHDDCEQRQRNGTDPAVLGCGDAVPSDALDEPSEPLHPVRLGVTTVGRMLTSFDDYPVHQACVPVAHTATADLNHYDRYFFNGYSSDGTLYFGLAMGLYPNRHVVDAAFSVITGDDGSREQASVFSSGRAPLDRRDATTVGPIRVEIVEPLRVARLHVDAPDRGLRAELTFTARSAAIEEPHFFLRVGVRPLFDYTRLTQFGAWAGWIELDGARHEIVTTEVQGSRDRSWGVRPVGEPAPTGAPIGAPQFFWLWAPVNFASMATHFDVNEFGDGRRWHEVGAIARDGEEPQLVRAVDYRVHWRPGTRWAERFEYDLIGWDDSVSTVRLEPLYEFQMSGLGYGHPAHGHGTWQGESMVAGERLALPVADPCDRTTIHIQALSKATFLGADGTVEHGIGILEQLAIGPHPTGLTGIFEPA